MSSIHRLNWQQAPSLPEAAPLARPFQSTELIHLAAATLVAAVSTQLVWHTWLPWSSAHAFGLAALAFGAYGLSVRATEQVGRIAPAEPVATVVLGVSLTWAALGLLVCSTDRQPHWAFGFDSWAASIILQLAQLGARKPRVADPAEGPSMAGLSGDLSKVERADGAGAAVEHLTGRVDPRSFQTVAPVPRRHAAIKQAAEVALIVVTSPLWGPIAAATALAIRLDSPGPIFFWQERIGAHGRPFRMLKFRSMRSDSERHGPQFAARGDARVTSVGRVIRKLRLDEVPQFWNVLRGEMSLIGPRPEQAAFVRRFVTALPGYERRHLLKPGITGWAQVKHGYAADADETRVKLEYDLYYVKHCSAWLDLLIVARTVTTMLTGFGAR